MNKPALISRPEDVTSQWLTQALKYNDINATVTNFSFAPIGTGQMARCFRFSLNIAGNAEAPCSLIAKFSSNDANTRQMASASGVYAAEVGFYQRLAPSLGISTPHCYFAAISEDNSNFILLLEDMSPAQQGDQLEGCSISIAREAVLQLAIMHAGTWNDKSLLQHSWLPPLRKLQKSLFKHQQALTPEFMRRLGHTLPPEIQTLISDVSNGWEPLIALLDEQPLSLIHWDFRADNLLINEEGSTPKLTAVDWQTIMVGAPLHDVAYFIGASLTTELRRTHETDLLKLYYEKLIKLGVTDYSWQECINGYKLGSFCGLTMAVRAAVLVEATDRGNKMFSIMAQRHGQHILDLQANTLLI